MLEGIRRTIIELGCINRGNEVLNKCFKTVMWNLLLYTHGSSALSRPQTQKSMHRVAPSYLRLWPAESLRDKAKPSL